MRSWQESFYQIMFLIWSWDEKQWSTITTYLPLTVFWSDLTLGLTSQTAWWPFIFYFSAAGVLLPLRDNHPRRRQNGFRPRQEESCRRRWRQTGRPGLLLLSYSWAVLAARQKVALKVAAVWLVQLNRWKPDSPPLITFTAWASFSKFHKLEALVA